MRSEAQKLYQL